MDAEFDIRIVHIGDEVRHATQGLHIAVRQVAPQTNGMLAGLVVPVATWCFLSLGASLRPRCCVLNAGLPIGLETTAGACERRVNALEADGAVVQTANKLNRIPRFC